MTLKVVHVAQFSPRGIVIDEEEIGVRRVNAGYIFQGTNIVGVDARLREEVEEFRTDRDICARNCEEGNECADMRA